MRGDSSISTLHQILVILSSLQMCQCMPFGLDAVVWCTCFSQGTEDNIHFTQITKQLTDDNDFMSQVTQRWRSPYLITQPLSCPVIPSTFCQAHTFLLGKKAFNHAEYFSPFARSFLQDGKPLRLFRSEIPYFEGYFHQPVKPEAGITSPRHTEL